MALYLVTGGAGFVASHIIDRLIAEGHEVFTIDDLSSGYIENVNPRCTFIQGRCEDASVLSQLGNRRFDAILHLAGQSSGERSFQDCQDECSRNVLSTMALVKYALRNEIRRFLYASSMAVYGDVLDGPASENLTPNPLSVNGVSKWASEEYLRLYSRYGLEPTSLRMFNTYGPREGLRMIGIYLSMAVRQRKVIVKGSLDRFRDFIEVNDMVSMWLKVLRSPATVGKVLNVGTGVKTTIGDLLKMLIQYVKEAAGASEIPVEVANGILGDMRGNFADMSLTGSLIELPNFTPLAEGLRRLIHYAV